MSTTTPADVSAPLTEQTLPFQLGVRRGVRGRWFIGEEQGRAFMPTIQMLAVFFAIMAIMCLLAAVYAILWAWYLIGYSVGGAGCFSYLVYVLHPALRRKLSYRIVQFIPSKSMVRIGSVTDGKEDEGKTQVFRLGDVRIRLHPLRVQALENWRLGYWGVFMFAGDQRILLAADRSREAMHAYMDAFPAPVKRLVTAGEGDEVAGAADIRLI